MMMDNYNKAAKCGNIDERFLHSIFYFSLCCYGGSLGLALIRILLERETSGLVYYFVAPTIVFFGTLAIGFMLKIYAKYKCPKCKGVAITENKENIVCKTCGHEGKKIMIVPLEWRR